VQIEFPYITTVVYVGTIIYHILYAFVCGCACKVTCDTVYYYIEFTLAAVKHVYSRPRKLFAIVSVAMSSSDKICIQLFKRRLYPVPTTYREWLVQNLIQFSLLYLHYFYFYFSFPAQVRPHAHITYVTSVPYTYYNHYYVNVSSENVSFCSVRYVLPVFILLIF